MHQSSSRLNKLSTILGWGTSVVINLLTNWLQSSILSNPAVLIIITIILCLFYFSIKSRNKPLLIASSIFMGSIFLNLLPFWLQKSLLHDSFPPSTVIIILLLSFLGCFIISCLMSTEKQIISLADTNLNEAQLEFKNFALQRELDKQRALDQAKQQRKLDKQRALDQAKQQRKLDKQRASDEARQQRKLDKQRERNEIALQRERDKQRERNEVRQRPKW